MRDRLTWASVGPSPAPTSLFLPLASLRLLQSGCSCSVGLSVARDHPHCHHDLSENGLVLESCHLLRQPVQGYRVAHHEHALSWRLKSRFCDAWQKRWPGPMESQCECQGCVVGCLFSWQRHAPCRWTLRCSSRAVPSSGGCPAGWSDGCVFFGFGIHRYPHRRVVRQRQRQRLGLGLRP